MLYTDNGSDFTSRHMEQVAVDLKIRLVFSTPGKPRGRGRIERFFRTVNEMFLCDLDGYTGRSRRKPRLTLGELERLFHHFLLETYHRRPSSDTGLSPRNDGRTAASCRACQIRWNSLIYCSSMKCGVEECARMEFISATYAISLQRSRPMWAKT